MSVLSKDIKEFIRNHLNDNPATLKLKGGLPDETLNFAIHQIHCRKKYKHKLPSWTSNEDIIFPATISMEQCSSEYTAKKKAEIVPSGNSFIDITGGFGVDTFYLSKKFNKTTHVEINKNLSEIVSYNFKILETDIETIHDSGLNYLKNTSQKYDLILVDPSRRSNAKGKVFLLEDCFPNIIEIQDFLLEKSGSVLIKLSPMLDISDVHKKLDSITDTYVISHKNEVKELLIILRNDGTSNGRHAINITKYGQSSEDFSSAHVNAEINIANKIESYIYEPNKAIIKLGIQNALGNKYQMQKLNPFSHIYTSDKLHLSFPGRVFRVDHIAKAQAKAIKNLIPTRKANVVTRNFPISAATLAKKLNIKDGGHQYIIGTTLSKDEKRLLICERIK